MDRRDRDAGQHAARRIGDRAGQHGFLRESVDWNDEHEQSEKHPPHEFSFERRTYFVELTALVS